LKLSCSRFKLAKQKGMFMQPSLMKKLLWRSDQDILSHQEAPWNGH